MAYESDVRRQASSLSSSVQRVRSEKNRIGSLVDSSNQWWKGKGGEAFIRGYKDIDNDVNRFLRSIDNAVDNLNRLPDRIARAERERREKREKEEE